VSHLQRNKIERTLPLVQTIHSVDSLRLLQALDQEATKQHRPLEVLLEVNASGETQKLGFAPSEVSTLIPSIQDLKVVRVQGLMTMARLEEDPQRCRPTFAALRELRDRLARELSPPHSLQHLS